MPLQLLGLNHDVQFGLIRQVEYTCNDHCAIYICVYILYPVQPLCENPTEDVWQNFLGRTFATWKLNPEF